MVAGHGTFFPRDRTPARNFSKPDSIREIEDYAVELSEVVVLELIIVPDKRNDQARASLRRLRLGRHIQNS